jgi:hemoglobin
VGFVSGAVSEPMLHDLVGTGFFVALVDAFYDGVEGDPVLLPLYPDGADTVGARRRLALFLDQYFGGPHTYMEERGHPRLRMRHGQWTIGPRERDRWLVHMAVAIETMVADLGDDIRDRVTEELATYMVNAAEHLRNA